MANDYGQRIDRSSGFSDRSGISTAYHTENQSKTYVLDWSPELGSDTISSVAYTTSGVTLASSSNNTTTTTMRITGTNGYVTVKITTAASQVFERNYEFIEPEPPTPTNDYRWST